MNTIIKDNIVYYPLNEVEFEDDFKFALGRFDGKLSWKPNVVGIPRELGNQLRNLWDHLNCINKDSNGYVCDDIWGDFERLIGYNTYLKIEYSEFVLPNNRKALIPKIVDAISFVNRKEVKAVIPQQVEIVNGRVHAYIKNILQIPAF